MTGPTINRHKSKQDYETPWAFIKAVEQRFGKLTLDVAASKENTKAPRCLTKEDNALTQSWGDGLIWCNPPFGNIEPWAAKCRMESTINHNKILLLTPASIGALWFGMHVLGHAMVFSLNPRLSFDGVSPFPKDCILSVFWAGISGFDVWKWK